MNKIRDKVVLGLPLILSLVSLPQISETIYTPALPAIAKGLATSVNAVESTLSIYFLGFALGVFLWGACSDFIGRRKTMIIGLCLYVFSCFACLQTQSIEALLIWRFVQAVGASVGSVITQTMLRDCYEGKRRAQIFAMISGVLSLSPAVGPILGGVLSEGLGWRSNFLFLVILGGLLAAWSAVKLPETRPQNLKLPSINTFRSLSKRMFCSSRLWGHVALIGATNGILFCFYQEAPFIFIEKMGIQPSLYGLLGLVVASATIVSAKLSYRLSGKSSPEMLIKAGAFLTTIGGAILLLIEFLGYFQLSGMAMIVAAFFVVFLGVGLIIPNSLSVALKDYQEMVGTAGSIFGAMYYVVIACATFGMSWMHDGSTLPLSLYMTFLGLILIFGSTMVQKPLIGIKENV